MTAMSVSRQETVMTDIYAAADWYRARPEPERVWQGQLQERPALVGPAGRTTLTYTGVTPDAHLPVYAPDGGHHLKPFVGPWVVVKGKLVDLRNEGLGQELWIGAVRIVD
jgi:hypothetical protein